MAHLALCLVLIGGFAVLNLKVVGAHFGYVPERFVDNGWQVLLFGAEMILAGGLLGATLMGCYLVLSSLLARMHRDHVFSAQHIPDFKSFLRLHIGPDGLTVYAIGVRRAVRKWIPSPAATDVQSDRRGREWRFRISPKEQAPWFAPAGEQPRPILLEKVSIGP